jgi:glycosyltransferase involved in cell wall biosynthesis
MPSTSRLRLLFLNRSYWPDAEATGQLLTELCEDLSARFDVSVLCGQPNQNLNNESFLVSGQQVRHGVCIERVNHTRFSKRSLPRKLLNFCSFLWSAFWRSWRLKRYDIIVCETDPFVLPFLAVWIRLLSGGQLVFYLQDIYPDIAVAVGKARPGLMVGLLRRMLRWCYRRAGAVVVLSEDMRRTIREWGRLEDVPIQIIPNWVDTARIRPIKENNAWREEHGLTDAVVIMYSGNLGLSQDLSIVLDAASQLRDRENLVFLFVGEGAAKDRLQQEANERGLGNVRFLPYQPGERLAESLSAADLQILPVRAEALKSLMPSKLYGILASGTAVVSTAPPDSELAQIIERAGAGESVHPYASVALSGAIRTLLADPSRVCQMGERGRQFAVEHYDRKLSVQKFGNLLQSLLSAELPPDSPREINSLSAERAEIADS